MTFSRYFSSDARRCFGLRFEALAELDLKSPLRDLTELRTAAHDPGDRRPHRPPPRDDLGARRDRPPLPAIAPSKSLADLSRRGYRAYASGGDPNDPSGSGPAPAAAAVRRALDQPNLLQEGRSGEVLDTWPRRLPPSGRAAGDLRFDPEDACGAERIRARPRRTGAPLSARRQGHRRRSPARRHMLDDGNPALPPIFCRRSPSRSTSLRCPTRRIRTGGGRRPRRPGRRWRPLSTSGVRQPVSSFEAAGRAPDRTCSTDEEARLEPFPGRLTIGHLDEVGGEPSPSPAGLAKTALRGRRNIAAVGRADHAAFNLARRWLEANGTPIDNSARPSIRFSLAGHVSRPPIAPRVREPPASLGGWSGSLGDSLRVLRERSRLR